MITELQIQLLRLEEARQLPDSALSRRYLRFCQDKTAEAALELVLEEAR